MKINITIEVDSDPGGLDTLDDLQTAATEREGATISIAGHHHMVEIIDAEVAP
jgi:hypothetical protein